MIARWSDGGIAVGMARRCSFYLSAGLLGVLASAAPADDPPGMVLRIGPGKPVADKADEPTGHRSRVERLAYSPDGKLLASVAADDPRVLLWHVPSGQLLRRLEVKGTARPTDLVFSPDMRLIAGSYYRAAEAPVCVWDVETGRLVHTEPGDEE